MRRKKGEETSIQETIRVCEILIEAGVDLRNVRLKINRKGTERYTTLLDIKQEIIDPKTGEEQMLDINKLAKENGLDINWEIGMYIHIVRGAYKGKTTYAITEEDKKEMENMPGILSKETAIQKKIRICKILIAEGVDLKKVNTTITENGKTRSTILLDIKQKRINEKTGEEEEIDIKEIAKRNGLSTKHEIGNDIRELRKTKCSEELFIITKEDKKEMENMLGILSKETSIQETIRICKILEEEGVFLSKIKLSCTEDGKIRSTTLTDVKQRRINKETGELEQIGINEIIEKRGLNSKFKIGNRIRELRTSYMGRGNSAITEQDRNEIEKLSRIGV